MPIASTDNMELNYRIDGDEGLPWLTLSNGLGLDLTMWDPQIPALSGQYRVLRYDTRGHGTSDTPAEPFAIGISVAMTFALLDRRASPDASVRLFDGRADWNLAGDPCAAAAGQLVLAHTAPVSCGRLEQRIDIVNAKGMQESPVPRCNAGLPPASSRPTGRRQRNEASMEHLRGGLCGVARYATPTSGRDCPDHCADNDSRRDAGHRHDAPMPALAQRIAGSSLVKSTPRICQRRERGSSAKRCMRWARLMVNCGTAKGRRAPPARRRDHRRNGGASYAADVRLRDGGSADRREPRRSDMHHGTHPLPGFIDVHTHDDRWSLPRLRCCRRSARRDDGGRGQLRHQPGSARATTRRLHSTCPEAPASTPTMRVRASRRRRAPRRQCRCAGRASTSRRHHGQPVPAGHRGRAGADGRAHARPWRPGPPV